MGFWIGFVLGCISAVVLASIGAVVVYRRYITLERRTLHAERLAELGTLTSGLAHEIKNPLSTLQLNLQLLKEQFDPNDPSTGRVLTRMGIVQREANRLREILDDFLKYAGKIELDRKDTNVNELLSDLVDFVAPQALLQKVQLRLRHSEQTVIAPIDSRFIKQAVLNLMLNALQAMAETGGELILSCGKNASHATIDVIDTGPGISPEKQAQIFQAYYSTKPGGTGLGLAIARRLIEEHLGKIRVQSEVGRGTDFTIELPLN